MALMPYVDIGIPRFGVVGLNEAYRVRNGMATRLSVAAELTNVSDPRRICVCCRGELSFTSCARSVLTSTVVR